MDKEEMQLIDKFVHSTDKDEQKQLLKQLVPDARDLFIDLYVDEAEPLEDSWIDDLMNTENVNKRYKVIHRNFDDAPKTVCENVARLIPYIPVDEDQKLYVEKTFDYTFDHRSPHIKQEDYTQEEWDKMSFMERYMTTAMLRDPDITPEEAQGLVELYEAEIRIEQDVMKHTKSTFKQISQLEFDTYRLCLQGTSYMTRIEKLYDLVGYGKDAEEYKEKAYEHWLSSVKNQLLPNFMLKSIMSADPVFRD